MQPKKTRLAGAFDIETSTVNGVAFAYAYIFKPMCSPVEIHRTPHDVIDQWEPLMADDDGEPTPVIASYNLAFDSVPLKAAFAERGYKLHEFKTASRTLAIDVYARDDDMDKSVPRLRLWDVAPFAPEGLAEMGQLVGLPKLEGELDYTIVRTPGTPLTDSERAYMVRDVEIIEAFLGILPEWCPWVKLDDLGRVAWTNASLARLFLYRRAGAARLGKETAMKETHAAMSRVRKHSTSEQEDLRRQAYAGGFTFVNPRYLWETVEDVHHFDVDSAYHFWPVARETPVRLTPLAAESVRARFAQQLQQTARELRSSADRRGAYPLEPQRFKWHARLRFTNLIRAERMQGIGYLSARRADIQVLRKVTPSGAASGEMRADGQTVAEFGRIAACERLTICVDENEFAALALAYDWDELESLEAEISTRDEMLALPALASALLRAEKIERKKQGGAQYAMFKRAYNSTAGIYAQAPRDTDGPFSLAYLPLAIRQTSFTRLTLVAAICEATRRGLNVVSGDTDSLKIQGDYERIQSMFASLEAQRGPVCMPAHLLDAGGIDAETLEDIGRWDYEAFSALHRELAPKRRAWVTEAGELHMRVSGFTTRKLERALNAAMKNGMDAAEALDWLSPQTAIDIRLARRMRAHRPRILTPFTLRVSACETLSEPWQGLVYPAIRLEERHITLGDLRDEELADRLAILGKLKKVQFAYLSPETLGIQA